MSGRYEMPRNRGIYMRQKGRICAVGWCDRPARCKGWCQPHYNRWHLTGSPIPGPKPTREERFWAKVDKSGPGGCWLWTATVNGPGYGTFSLGADRAEGEPRQVMAHRWSYEAMVGPIPEGLHIDHLCRVPRCVNPSHLEPVTRSENARRGIHSNHMGERTHCKYGHPFIGENYSMSGNTRICRVCKRERMRRTRAARRAQ